MENVPLCREHWGVPRNVSNQRLELAALCEAASRRSGHVYPVGGQISGYKHLDSVPRPGPGLPQYEGFGSVSSLNP